MTITYRTISNASYESARDDLLKFFENRPLATGALPFPLSIDPVPRPNTSFFNATIGYGLDLREISVADLNQYISDANAATGLSLALSTSDIALITRHQLATTDPNYLDGNDPSFVLSFQIPSEAYAAAMLNSRLTNDDEITLDAYLSNNGVTNIAPDSLERVALVSLWFNGGANTIGSGLLAALSGTGDRAEAWYQIRYETSPNNSIEAGIQKRRYAEAELFGLYNDGPVTSADAIDVYETIAAHRAKIFEEENEQSAQIANANSEFPLPTLQLTLPSGATVAVEVRTLEASLMPAYDVIKTDFIDPIGSYRSISPLDVHVATSSMSNLTGSQRDHYDLAGNTDRNDLLIGDANVNVLNGLGGEDILIGGAESDTYEIATGDGHDVLVDTGVENSVSIDGSE